MKPDELQKIHDLMLPAVRDAGKSVMQFFRSSDYTVTHKDAENPVTDADFAANRILRTAIEKYFPADAILSEESDSAAERASMDRRFKTERVWILDPIDGTREFIHGRDQFAVSAGLVEDGKAILGFICNPARDYLLTGGAGIGLFKDGVVYPARARSEGPWPEDIALHPPDRLPKICVSRSEHKSGKLTHLEKRYGDLSAMAIGSIAYKLALVADGTFDLVVSVKPKNEWDIAGGAALLNAVGLELREGNYEPVVFNKPQTESFGLVAGTRAACGWYRNLSSQ